MLKAVTAGDIEIVTVTRIDRLADARFGGRAGAGDAPNGRYIKPDLICCMSPPSASSRWQSSNPAASQSMLASLNTVHFAIRMAALKSMRVVGCGVRGRNG